MGADGWPGRALREEGVDLVLREVQVADEVVVAANRGAIRRTELIRDGVCEESGRTCSAIVSTTPAALSPTCASRVEQRHSSAESLSVKLMASPGNSSTTKSTITAPSHASM